MKSILVLLALLTFNSYADDVTINGVTLNDGNKVPAHHIDSVIFNSHNELDAIELNDLSVIYAEEISSIEIKHKDRNLNIPSTLLNESRIMRTKVIGGDNTGGG